MKKLFTAIVFIFLAALTETPDDHILTAGSDGAQVNSYISAWVQAESEGAIFVDQDEPFSEVQSDQMNFDAELHPAAI